MLYAIAVKECRTEARGLKVKLTPERLVTIAMTNPINAQIVGRLPSLGLSQCMLTAGCLFQAVWNLQSNLPPESDVKDYDIFYFDTDLSWEAESDGIVRTRQLFAQAFCRYP